LELFTGSFCTCYKGHYSTSLLKCGKLNQQQALLWNLCLSFFPVIMNSQLFLMIRSLRYASISFGILYYIFLRGFWGFFYLFGGWQNSNFASKRTFFESYDLIFLLCICYSQIAKATTDPDPNSKGQRAWSMSFWWGFLTSGPEGIFLSLSFILLSFFRADLTFLLDLPASTRGQASEASWFPGMWVNSILW